MADLRDVQDLLTIKKRDLDEWARQEKAAQAELLTLVSGGTGSSVTPRPSFAALQELFKSKIKRAKKKPAAVARKKGKSLTVRETARSKKTTTKKKRTKPKTMTKMTTTMPKKKRMPVRLDAT